MKIAILVCGHVRSWNPDHFRAVFGDSVDVYFSTYTKPHGFHPYIRNYLNIQNNDEIYSQDEIRQMFQIEYKQANIEAEPEIDESFLRIHSDTYAQYRKFEQCLSMMEDSEIEYDLVVKTRFDVKYSCALADILRNCRDTSKIYISSGPSVYPCDQVFIGTPRMMRWFAHQLVSASANEVVEEKMSPHAWVEKQGGWTLVMAPFRTEIVRNKKSRYKW